MTACFVVSITHTGYRGKGIFLENEYLRRTFSEGKEIRQEIGTEFQSLQRMFN